MSLIQFDLPGEAIRDRSVRRALINAVVERIPTGAGKGQRSVRKSRHVSPELGRQVAIEGASPAVCRALGIPEAWAERCEDAAHAGHDETRDALERRLDFLLTSGGFPKFDDKIAQLGSYGSGNHFGECEVVQVAADDRARRRGGSSSGCEIIASLRSCRTADRAVSDIHLAKSANSRRLADEIRGMGHSVARPATSELVYAPKSEHPRRTTISMTWRWAANFATVNHLLINALGAGGVSGVRSRESRGSLVYFISHNIARREIHEGRPAWVHRKGATRAFPGGHPSLAGTPFAATGHPILLPGNPEAGSAIMAADPGAAVSCFSVNHGAGRAMGRKAAIRALDQKAVDESLEAARHPLQLPGLSAG